MAILDFTTSTKNRTAPDITFVLDGEEYTARCPKVVHWVQLIAAGAGRSAEQARALGVFLDMCLYDRDAQLLERRLRDHDDDLDHTDLLRVMNALVAEWDPYMADEMADAGMDDPRAVNRTQRRATSSAPVRRKAAPAKRPVKQLESKA